MKEASPTLVPGTVVTETTRPAETAAGAPLAKTSSFTVGEIRVKVEDAMERYPWMSQQSLEKLYDLFDAWDTDKGGTITPEEMRAQMDGYSKKLFDRIDTDASGRLSWDEMKKLTEMLQLTLSDLELKEEWKKMNSNNDLSVDRQEFMDWWNDMESGVSMVDLFARMDVGDQDGRISDDEFIACISLKLEDEHLENLDGDQMVRMSLEKLRDDVRAIYGTRNAPSVTLHQLRKEAATKAAERKCWCNYGGPTLADRLLNYWDVAQAFILVYIAVIVPIRMAEFVPENTDLSSPFFWWEVFVDAFFATDVVLRFRIGYTTHKGNLETGRWNVAKRYLRGWFLIDFVACMPVRYIEMAVGSEGAGSNLRALKIIRLVRLGKMLRLGKLQVMVKHLTMMFNVPGLWTGFRLFTLLLAVLYMSHVTACIWYSIGDDVQHVGGELIFYGWRHPETDHHGLGWDLADDIHWTTKYLDSFYFAVT